MIACMPSFCDICMQQYWTDTNSWEFVPVVTFAKAFEATSQGQRNLAALKQPENEAQKHTALDPLVRQKCVQSGLYGACICVRMHVRVLV